MSNDILRCPHCKVRVRRPKPSAHETFHRRTCRKCKKKYVVYDEVEHYVHTAVSPPVKVGQRFKLKPTTFGPDSPSHGKLFTIHSVRLTRYQGWWVFGVRRKGECSVSCEDIDVIQEKSK